MNKTENQAWIFFIAGLAVLSSGCASEDIFKSQHTRVAYEVGDNVTRARPEFARLWNWYLATLDAAAPTTEVEVCLTISPQGKVTDSYIDSATIREPEFIKGILDIYNHMRFAARDVEELTICDEPLVFYSVADTRELRRQHPQDAEQAPKGVLGPEADGAADEESTGDSAPAIEKPQSLMDEVKDEANSPVP